MMAITEHKMSPRRRLDEMIGSFARDESGATAIEYTLIVALIFLTIVAAVRAYTQTTSGMYNNIASTLENG